MENSDFISKVFLEKFDKNVGLERGAGKFREIAWYFLKTVFFLSAVPYPSWFKCAILRFFGAKIGAGVVIKPRVNIHFPWKLAIGNFVWLGEEVYILNFEKTVLESNVCISQRAFLCGGNHNYLDPSFCYRNGPIFIKEGVWIGACSFVGPNVIIGTDTVVTAGSVVTVNLPSNGIFRGNPAEFVRKRWSNNSTSPDTIEILKREGLTANHIWDEINAHNV